MVYLENEAKQHVSCGEPALAIAQLNVSSTIPFIVALQEACKVFELHDLKEFNRNLAPSEDLAFKIKNSLKDASLKDLSLLSCLMKHSTSDELRRNVAEHILSLCAPYFLLAKHDPESRSRSRHWGLRCHAVFSTLKHHEWIFLRTYIEESLKLLPVARAYFFFLSQGARRPKAINFFYHTLF